MSENFLEDLYPIYPFLEQIIGVLKKDPAKSFLEETVGVSLVSKHTEIYTNGNNEIHILRVAQPYTKTSKYGHSGLTSCDYRRIFAVYLTPSSFNVVEFGCGVSIGYQMYEKCLDDPDYFVVCDHREDPLNEISRDTIDIYRGEAPTPNSWFNNFYKLTSEEAGHTTA